MSTVGTIRVELIANAQKFKKGIDGAKAKTKELGKATDLVSNKQKKFQTRLRDVAGSIAAVQGPLGPVAGRLNAIGAITGRVSGKLLAFLGIGTLAAVVLGKFIKAGARAESQFLKLNAILKATGNAAGQTATDIEVLAESIGKNTLASVQGARDAAGVLLTFKSITGETFGEVLKLSQDLAAVGFGSIQTAAIQLGKALEEPEIGLSSLRRVGVSFTEQQKEVIKVLALTGRQAEAQEIILKALEDQVGGAGKGAAKGLSGAFDTLGENITLFFEKAKAGKAIVAALTTIITGLANIIGKFIPEEAKLPQTIEGANKAIQEQKEKIAELNQQLIELRKNQGAKFSERRIAAKKDEIKQEFVLLEALKEKKKLLETETVTVNKAVEIFKKANRKQIRGIEDEINKKLALDEVSKIQLNNEIALRNALISKLGDSKTALEFIDALIKANEENFAKTAETVARFNQAFEDTDKIATSVANEVTNVGDKLVDAFLRGETSALNFKNILRELLISIQKTIIQVLILDRVNRAIRKGITSIFAPQAPSSITETLKLPPSQKAGGGAIQRNTPTLVGERGPELFVPKTAGVITPSSLTPSKMGGGGSVVINQNLNFALGVTNTVRTEIANLLPQIQQSTISAVADAKLRGGKFAKAFGG